MNMKRRTIWFLGASTAVVAVALPVGGATASKVMSGDFSAFSAVKWSSIIATTGLVIFFLVRQGVFANENLEEGERGYRRRWGKVVTRRKTGTRTLLMPGKKHFYVKHMYDVVVQSIRVRSSPEQPNLDKPARATFNRKNIWYVLVINWRVIDSDDSIYKSLTKVYQINRAAEGNDALENFVMNETLKTVRRCLSKFDADADGLPILTIDTEVAHVPDELLALQSELASMIGVQLESIDPILLTEAPEEAIRDLKNQSMFT